MINYFSGKYLFLSNFYPAYVKLDNYIFPTVENAYQAAKTEDINIRNEFLTLTPGDAKKKGKLLTLRPSWEEKKLHIMECLLRQKFNQKYFKDLLLKTVDEELIEGNYWGDKFWGMYKGEGENHLGRLLMKIRQEKRRENE